MTAPPPASPSEPQNDLDRAGRGAEVGIVGEFLAFLGHNKKWWLLPILVVILLMGLLVMLNSTGAAPFIYSLF